MRSIMFLSGRLLPIVLLFLSGIQCTPNTSHKKKDDKDPTPKVDYSTSRYYSPNDKYHNNDSYAKNEYEDAKPPPYDSPKYDPKYDDDYEYGHQEEYVPEPYQGDDLFEQFYHGPTNNKKDTKNYDHDDDLLEHYFHGPDNYGGGDSSTGNNKNPYTNIYDEDDTYAHDSNYYVSSTVRDKKNRYDKNKKNDDYTYNDYSSSSVEKKEVTIIIRPYSQACPKASPGRKTLDKVFPVVILGSSTLDVSLIDFTTVTLSGTSGKGKIKPPNAWSLLDIASPISSTDKSNVCCQRFGSKDGRTDVILRFLASDVASIPEVSDASIGDEIRLKIEGIVPKSDHVTKAFTIEGTDCVVKVY